MWRKAERNESIKDKFFWLYSIWKNEPRASVSENWNKNNYIFMMYPELIENSQDREEVVEKDWIDDVMRDIAKIDDKAQFRKILEKHAPKVKKIRKSEVQGWYVEKHPILIYGTSVLPTLNFLEEQNLLADD